MQEYHKEKQRLKEFGMPRKYEIFILKVMSKEQKKKKAKEKKARDAKWKELKTSQRELKTLLENTCMIST